MAAGRGRYYPVEDSRLAVVATAVVVVVAGTGAAEDSPAAASAAEGVVAIVAELRLVARKVAAELRVIAEVAQLVVAPELVQLP